MRMRIKDGRALEKSDKHLLDFARSYLSEAFPNPDREGCPPESALRSLAFNPKQSEPTVTEHLAACSPCFRRYAELFAESDNQICPQWTRTEGPVQRSRRIPLWLIRHLAWI